MSRKKDQTPSEKKTKAPSPRRTQRQRRKAKKPRRRIQAALSQTSEAVAELKKSVAVSVGAAICAKRLEAGYTMEDLYLTLRSLGFRVSLSTISRWELGKSPPRLDELAMLELVLPGVAALVSRAIVKSLRASNLTTNSGKLRLSAFHRGRPPTGRGTQAGGPGISPAPRPST